MGASTEPLELSRKTAVSKRQKPPRLYRLLLPKGGNLLDLCSQHDSHLPPEARSLNGGSMVASRRSVEMGCSGGRAKPDWSSESSIAWTGQALESGIGPLFFLNPESRMTTWGGGKAISLWQWVMPDSRFWDQTLSSLQVTCNRMALSTVKGGESPGLLQCTGRAQPLSSVNLTRAGRWITP